MTTTGTFYPSRGDIGAFHLGPVSVPQTGRAFIADDAAYAVALASKEPQRISQGTERETLPSGLTDSFDYAIVDFGDFKPMVMTEASLPLFTRHVGSSLRMELARDTTHAGTNA